MARERRRTITWSTPAPWTSMLATSLAVMGARDLSFLSCRAYGKCGLFFAVSDLSSFAAAKRAATHTTAVMRLAEAILSVCAMMQSLRAKGQ